MPEEVYEWSPVEGDTTVDGGGDAFDPNYYAGQDRDNGFASGDPQGL